MKFFIDTANVEEIRKANDMGIIAGVTTNPSLIAKEGRDYAETLAEIATIVDGPISGEVKATTADAVDCARRALRDGGRFLLCQRPEQLAEILAALRAARLEPKRLAFVKNRPDAAPWLFLVEAQKGRKTGLRVEPDILIQSGAALYGPTTL